MNLTPALELSFWSGVDKRGGEDACWPWIRCKPNKRYGGFFTGTKYHAAHRIALELSGVPVPKTAHVLHSCDNTVCCNPKHLSIGNHLVNMNQCVIRGRKNTGSGEKNGNNKLTEEQVYEIRRLRTILPRQEIAARFSIYPSTVRRILLRQIWKHLEEEEKK